MGSMRTRSCIKQLYFCPIHIGGAPRINPDQQQAAQIAKQHADDDDDDDKEGFFKSILSNVLDNDDDDKELKEDDAQQAARAHDEVYNKGNSENTSSRDMGMAAAMQAFKMFSGNNNQSGGGAGSSAMVGLAMGEAMKLFKNKGGEEKGFDKSELIQTAVKMAIKLYLAKQAGDAASGGLQTVMNMMGMGDDDKKQQQQQQQQQQQEQGGFSKLLNKFF
ncbi:hypothetical protein BDF20DRAFT_865656 [Mycotypha africana]|uniref:uncharacterized protein n=1 Tax=Mycotypha africana TaxID=64632 RepID=UPI002301634F|nr:uncharacterized protein BDF20DRAFT_865656 [Mycotypha africana]KAI8982217.1 hypothetical protein BDF20DRAFT_865656 [Mycotypha africana]